MYKQWKFINFLVLAKVVITIIGISLYYIRYSMKCYQINMLLPLRSNVSKVETLYHDNDLILTLIISPQSG
jgi:hypothetical protein